jgi:hypothetical protein
LYWTGQLHILEGNKKNTVYKEQSSVLNMLMFLMFIFKLLGRLSELRYFFLLPGYFRQFATTSPQLLPAILAGQPKD